MFQIKKLKLMNGPSHSFSRIKHLLTSTAVLCEPLLRQFGATPALSKTKQVHALAIISSSLLSSSIHSNLAKMYAFCGHLSYARKLFDELPDRSSFLYNAFIKMYVQNDLSYDALKLFVEMFKMGQCQPDNFTYPQVIKACSELLLLEVGVIVHGRTFVAGFGLDTFVQNTLLAMYMNCGEKETAKRVFDAMQERPVVSWNTMIKGYFRNGSSEEALMIFNQMMDVGMEPDCATVVSVLPACGYMKDMVMGRKVNALVEEKGLGRNIKAKNALVDMYAKCGRMDEAQLVFDSMDKRDVVTWTTMINGYILNDDARSALELCWIMYNDGVKPNAVTMVALLAACGSLCIPRHGQCLHGWTLRQNLDRDVIVETALIDMYAKCKYIGHSFRVFLRTSKNRTAPWNAIFSGCIYNGHVREATELFKQMPHESVHPNHATLNSLLPAYSILADFHQAMNMHCYLIRSGFLSCVEVATGLIDIYSKCGSLESAYNIFKEIPNKNKDIILWSVIVAAYGTHGEGKTAVSLFDQMVQSGASPNEVTFTSVLHACSHAGLVDDGLRLFMLILENSRVTPQTDHYTCIVDLLGRAGRLGEAYDLIKNMPSIPNHAIWGALLGACVIHENVEIGQIAAKRLLEIDPENTGNYVLMAKIYASVGRWKDAENVRLMMGEIGLRKAPAHSLLEVRSV